MFSVQCFGDHYSGQWMGGGVLFIYLFTYFDSLNEAAMGTAELQAECASFSLGLAPVWLHRKPRAEGCGGLGAAAVTVGALCSPEAAAQTLLRGHVPCRSSPGLQHDLPLAWFCSENIPEGRSSVRQPGAGPFPPPCQ